MRRLACVTLLLLAARPAFAANAEAEPADVLATYERGKAAYDQGDYEKALEAFDQAAQADPTRARWQYNRALALKKLGRGAEAVEAFHKSRALDPGYKVAEIDKKLAELGSGSGAGGDDGSWDGAVGACVTVCFLLFGVGVTFFSVRHQRKQVAAFQPQALETRLRALSERLVGLEHRFARGEDAEARSQLEWATAQEREARKLLPKAALKLKKGRATAACLDVAERAAQECAKRLDAAFGPAEGGARGERVGCWFCAKPLANPAVRVSHDFKLGAQQGRAVACAECAALAAQGRPPRVVMVSGPKGMTHWSLAKDYDPYLHRHQPHAGAQPLGLHKVPAGGDLGRVGLAVAGGAAALGAVAAAAQLFDLDLLGKAAAAEAAAKAAAAGKADLSDQS